MSILSRFSDIVSANINALLEKAEDPAKMIDHYLMKAKEDLAAVKEETAAVMAEEARCKRLMDDAQDEVEKYEKLAKKALKAGNEGDARQLIERKQELEKSLIAATNNYTLAKNNADKMRQMYEKLSQDVATLQARRSNIKATVAVAKTQERINQINSERNLSNPDIPNAEFQTNLGVLRAYMVAYLQQHPMVDETALLSRARALSHGRRKSRRRRPRFRRRRWAHRRGRPCRLRRELWRRRQLRRRLERRRQLGRKLGRQQPQTQQHPSGQQRISPDALPHLRPSGDLHQRRGRRRKLQQPQLRRRRRHWLPDRFRGNASGRVSAARVHDDLCIRHDAHVRK